MVGTDKRLGRASRLRVDETGNKYGRLTVIGYAGWDKASGYALWKCRCDCGKESGSGNDGQDNVVRAGGPD